MIEQSKRETASSPKASACEHDWKDLPVPGEGKGRIYQCTKCKTCGHRQRRLGGRGGKIVVLSCNVGSACRADAKVRLFGRARRGQFRWSCSEHSCGQQLAATT